MTLFDDPAPEPVPEAARPLADRMRPTSLDELLGQDETLGPDTALRRLIEDGEAGSLLLWGPPGSGKTTLANLIAECSGLRLEPFSAVLSGVKDVRAAVARADVAREREGRGTMLFIDEIHRFNKSQQDAFLPVVESGRIVLVGATTENPSFSINRALLSRCRVVVLAELSDEAVGRIVDRALADEERGLGRLRLSMTAPARERLVWFAAGDARRALNVLEVAAKVACASGAEIDVEQIAEAAQKRALAHDKSGDHHFDLLSALHKSLRNSDVQASVYWLARFLDAGADPLQAARRMVAMAAEDIGLADPMALQIATSALVALQNIGLPEGRLPLCEAAIYLASAPKSNAVARAIGDASREVRDGRQHAVPLHLRNAPTRLARELGHGAGYRYAHDAEGGVADIECLPDALAGRRFYEPGDAGFEPKVQERLRDIERRRARDRGGSP